MHANNKVNKVLVLGKTFYKESIYANLFMQQLMQKKCIRLILLLTKKNFV